MRVQVNRKHHDEAEQRNRSLLLYWATMTQHRDMRKTCSTQASHRYRQEVR